MRKPTLSAFLLLLALPCAAAHASERAVLEAEQIFADFLDAHGAVETIDSGLRSEIEGDDRATWQRRRDEARAKLEARLKDLQRAELASPDDRAVRNMQLTFDELTDPGASMAPDRKCADATRPEKDVDVLQTTLYACFDEVGNQLTFEGERITRGGALQQLQEIEEPARRKALFMAMHRCGKP
jgi:hypothetical protein